MNIQEYCSNKKYDYIYPLFAGFIVIIVLFNVLNYLNRLEDCKCFNDNVVYKKYKIDIDFLKAYQWLEIFLTLILIYVIFSYKKNICGKKNYSKHNRKLLSLLSMIVLPLVFMLSVYITYNSFLLYVGSKEKCKCSDKWQKYYIYFQGIMGFIMLFRFVFIFLFVIMLIIYVSLIGKPRT
tara:strand:+ start:14161 stop:14700 length:540 start_codon:yes stop_codon:yes gene_type:complete